MCFSATASFAAGGILSAAGVVTLAKNKEKRATPLAAMPLLFGIQQTIEGFLWLNSNPATTWNQPLTYAFLFFALILWPTYMPVTTYLLEKNALRKKIISGFIVLGALVSAYLVFIVTRFPVSSEITNHSIQYNINKLFPEIGTVLYVIATCGSGLASSRKPIFIFGIFLTISFLISTYFYFYTLVSIWCFATAILSGIIYVFVWKTKLPAL